MIRGQEDEIRSLKQTVRQLESEKLEQRNIKSGNARDRSKSKEMMMVEQPSSGKNSLDFNLQRKSGGQQPNQKEVVDTRSRIDDLT